MEAYGRTEAEKIAEKEKKDRRVQRIAQVRKQTNDWLSKKREDFSKAKAEHVDDLISEVTEEVTNDAIKSLEEMSKIHRENLQEIGTAHRAAANYPNYAGIKALKHKENRKVAKQRFVHALKKTKKETVEKQEQANRLLQRRSTVRTAEDIRSKFLVDRKPFRSLNTDKKNAETVNEKLRKKGYQQAYASSLVYPGKSPKGKRKTGKRKSKKKKSKRPKSPKAVKDIRSGFEFAHRMRTAGIKYHRKPVKNVKRARSKSPGDVWYVDARLPIPPQKYKPPKTLAERDPIDESTPSAWDIAETLSKEIQEEKIRIDKENIDRSHRIQKRGNDALKKEKLQRRYNQLAAQLLSPQDEDEHQKDVHERINEIQEKSPVGIIPIATTVSSPPEEDTFISKLHSEYKKLISASEAQMKSLMEDEGDGSNKKQEQRSGNSPKNTLPEGTNTNASILVSDDERRQNEFGNILEIQEMLQLVDQELKRREELEQENNSQVNTEPVDKVISPNSALVPERTSIASPSTISQTVNPVSEPVTLGPSSKILSSSVSAPERVSNGSTSKTLRSSIPVPEHVSPGLSSTSKAAPSSIPVSEVSSFVPQSKNLSSSLRPPGPANIASSSKTSPSSVRAAGHAKIASSSKASPGSIPAAKPATMTSSSKTSPNSGTIPKPGNFAPPLKTPSSSLPTSGSDSFVQPSISLKHGAEKTKKSSKKQLKERASFSKGPERKKDVSKIPSDEKRELGKQMLGYYVKKLMDMRSESVNALPGNSSPGSSMSSEVKLSSPNLINPQSRTKGVMDLANFSNEQAAPSVSGSSPMSLPEVNVNVEYASSSEGKSVESRDKKIPPKRLSSELARRIKDLCSLQIDCFSTAPLNFTADSIQLDSDQSEEHESIISHEETKSSHSGGPQSLDYYENFRTDDTMELRLSDSVLAPLTDRDEVDIPNFMTEIAREWSNITIQPPKW